MSLPWIPQWCRDSLRCRYKVENNLAKSLHLDPCMAVATSMEKSLELQAFRKRSQKLLDDGIDENTILARVWCKSYKFY